MQSKKNIMKIKKIIKRYIFFRVILFPLVELNILFKLVLKSINKFFLSIYCYKTVKIYLSNHLTIGIWSLYRKRTKFPHPVGVVIGRKVKIGYDCIIYQNVTIGTANTLNYLTSNYPKIGNNVTIYPNSIIIGDISIGDNSIIGAGSIVLNDVPANSVARGIPAKSNLIKKLH